MKLFKIQAWRVSQISVSQTNWSCCDQWNTQEYHHSRARRTSTLPSKSTWDRNVSLPTFLPVQQMHPWHFSSHQSMAWDHHSPSQPEIMRGYQLLCVQQSTCAEFCLAVGSGSGPRSFTPSDTHPAALQSKVAAPLCRTCAIWESTHTAPAPWPSPGGSSGTNVGPGQRLLLHNPPSHTEQRVGSKCMQHFIEKIRMFCT